MRPWDGKVLSNVYYCSSTDVYLFKNTTTTKNKNKTTLMISTLGSEAKPNSRAILKFPKILHNIHNNAIRHKHNFTVQKKGAIVAEKRALYFSSIPW